MYLPWVPVDSSLPIKYNGPVSDFAPISQLKKPADKSWHCFEIPSKLAIDALSLICRYVDIYPKVLVYPQIPCFGIKFSRLSAAGFVASGLRYHQACDVPRVMGTAFYLSRRSTDNGL